MNRGKSSGCGWAVGCSVVGGFAGLVLSYCFWYMVAAGGGPMTAEGFYGAVAIGGVICALLAGVLGALIGAAVDRRRADKGEAGTE